uniref:Interleukin-7 receptor subunit alpha n=1 Tax=Pseudonaja textilis TaxID=8673 RepID=A0A670YMR0_PSETE
AATDIRVWTSHKPEVLKLGNFKTCGSGFTSCLNSRGLRIVYAECDFVCVYVLLIFKLSFAVKPEAPFGLNITYQEKANEYLVQFSTTHVANSFLKDKLIHQLAYRQENTNWTVMNLDSPLTLLKFEPEVTYEMKVRSRPNGHYFKGHWSDWSSSQYFKPSARTSSGISEPRFLI